MITGKLNQSSIFFHMGPGLHSQIEAQAFSAQHSHVLFLDQPLDADFVGLKKWAQEKIRAQFQATGDKLTLLGHSFGSQIIAAALPEVTDCVKEIRMMGSAFDSFDSFVALDQTLNPQTAQSFEFWKNRPVDEKLNLIFKLAATPGYQDAYWKSPTARASYDLIASQKPGLNIDAFLKVYEQYLTLPGPSFTWDGIVNAYFSLSDSLIRHGSAVESWSKIYPNIRFHELSGFGHNPHFESPDFANRFFAN